MGPRGSRPRQLQVSKFSENRDRRKSKGYLDGEEDMGTTRKVESEVNSGRDQVKMKLSVSKHMVLAFLGPQGATQSPKHRKSKFSVPPPPHPPKINRAIPEREVGGTAVRPQIN